MTTETTSQVSKAITLLSDAAVGARDAIVRTSKNDALAALAIAEERARRAWHLLTHAREGAVREIEGLEVPYGV